jgi:hypothetical protein
MVVPHEILVPTTGAFSTCSFIPPGVLTPGQPETAPPPTFAKGFSPLLLSATYTGHIWKIVIIEWLPGFFE